MSTRYTEDHEWITVDGDVATVGITNYAQEQLGELQEQQAAEQQQREESAVEEARRKQREANCATARSNLEVINSNARIRVEENGETRYLSPEEIEQQRQKFQEIADENCGPEQEGSSER